MTKLSIIIPVHNCVNYLEQCLQSILSQTFDDWEIICINDGSTDDSLSILNRFAAQDSRIHIFNQSPAQGAGAARNFGISQAKGKFIHFLDSDDWLEVQAYTQLLPLMEQKGSDICIFQYNQRAEQSLTPVRLFDDCLASRTVKFEDCPEFFIKSSVVPWNKIYQTSFLKKHKLRFDNTRCANDRFFYFSLFTCNPQICFHSGQFVNYRRQSSQSLSRHCDLTAWQCHLQSFEKIMARYQAFPVFIRSLLVDVCIKDLQNMYRNTLDFSKAIRQEIITTLDKLKITPPHYAGCNWYGWYKRIFFSQEIIPIVFACNENYLPCLSVTLTSLLQNAAPQQTFDIYILYKELSKSSQEKILYFNEIYPSAAIELINVSQFIDHQNLYQCAHYSNEMYYRLLIPELLQNYEKVLYLDCDLIVNADISPLYKTDVDNCLLAAAINFTHPGMKNYIQKNLLLPSETYVNSGVLLINTRKCLQFKLKERCLELIAQRPGLYCPDQDILNLCARGQIKFLELKWNFYWQFLVIPNSEQNIDSLPPAEKDIYLQTLYNKPAVIHYTSAIKPWNNTSSVLGCLWWQYAARSPFYREILLLSASPREDSLSARTELLYDAAHRFSLYCHFWRCKLLSVLTWGAKHTHYKRKRKEIKHRLKKLKMLIK